MPPIVTVILVSMALAAAVALGVSIARSVLSRARGPALLLSEVERGDHAVVLEVRVVRARKVRVEGIEVGSDFASRVLAQPPAGFVRARAGGAPPRWIGRVTVKRGDARRVVIPMCTDIAASGCFTLVYSFRTGFTRSTRSASVAYRPQLVAVNG